RIEASPDGLQRGDYALPPGLVDHLLDEIRPLASLLDEAFAGQIHDGALGPRRDERDGRLDEDAARGRARGSCDLGQRQLSRPVALRDLFQFGPPLYRVATIRSS